MQKQLKKNEQKKNNQSSMMETIIREETNFESITANEDHLYGLLLFVFC
ncbi:hypothetical protein HYE26_02765 [Mycoplasmopsis bovis]|nr:hypothetical protein HYE26_02765 [Mycoplasmopsis bovis]